MAELKQKYVLQAWDTFKIPSIAWIIRFNFPQPVLNCLSSIVAHCSFLCITEEPFFCVCEFEQ